MAEDHFNQGNDCDTCVHKYIRLDNTKTCNRQEAGLGCEYQERELRTCPVCGGEVYRDEMLYTKDCHGITFRLVCWNCYNRLMEKGYDGEYYDEADEQIDDDY